MRLLSTAAVLGLCLAAAAPASAQRMRVERDEQGKRLYHGLYFAAGGGLGYALPNDGANALAFLGELRLGYSFNRSFQLFLSADTGGHSHAYSATFSEFQMATNFLAALRYFLFVDEDIGLYVRGGLGLGMISGSSVTSGTGANTVGLATAGGVGVEIRLDKHWSITPEGFYRSTDQGQAWGVYTIGGAILLNYN